MSSHELLPRPETFIPLIINGDDFGYSEAVNRAIIRAHLEGILTSASLMVNERAAEDAVELAKAHPGMAVGLHLVLSQGRAALPHDEIPQITDSQGRFRIAQRAPVSTTISIVKRGAKCGARCE